MAAVDELPNDAPLGKKRKYRTKHLLEDVPNKRVVSMDGSDAIPIDVEVVAHGQSEQPGPQTAITTSSNGAEEGDSSQPIVDPPSSSAEQLTETPQQNENVMKSIYILRRYFTRLFGFNCLLLLSFATE